MTKISPRPFFFLSQKEVDLLLASFDSEAKARFGPDGLVARGMRDLAMYQRRLLEAMVSAGLNKKERTLVVTLAAVVKSKTEVLATMGKFKGQPWYQKVKSFFEQHTCHSYKAQEVEGMFSVVHIPSCAPFVSAWAFAHTTQDDDATLEMMIKNFWFAQINVDPALLEKQKAWEMDFWEANGKNCNGGFDEDFWLAKAFHRWPLFTKDGSEWPMAGAAYSAAEVEEYIERMKQEQTASSEMSVDHN